MPRVKDVLAGLAPFDTAERLRRPERAVDERRSVVDMLERCPIQSRGSLDDGMYQLQVVE